MKITLDITDLVAKGHLTEEEATRLKGFAVQDTGALGVNVLMAFGAVAISAGIGVLVPSVYTAIALGALFFGVGFALTLAKEQRWGLFAQICMVIGALGFTGGISALVGGNFWVNIGLTLLVAIAAVMARSGLLASVAVLALTAAVGTAFSDWDTLGGATVITILVLAVLAIGLYQLSLRLPAYERLAIIGARTATFMINVAFLFGSIFGDAVTGIRGEVFAVVWAVLLLGVGLWGVRAGRRWVVNTAAVFGAIHALVQWFYYFGASPVSILGGGVLLILFGFGLKALIDRKKSAVSPA
jgi:hypothetical protein